MCLLFNVVLAGILLFTLLELKRMHKDYTHVLDMNRELFLENAKLENVIKELKQ